MLTKRAEKLSKAEAAYVEYSKEKQCQDCSMFRAPMACISVRGEIYSQGHCKLWAPRDDWRK